MSTDDDDVAEAARRYGAEVPFCRPPELARDPATVVDVLLHALERYDAHGQRFEHVATLLATAPFTALDDVTGAMRTYHEHGAGAVLSVTGTESPPYNTMVLEADGHTLAPAFPDSPYRATKSTECPATYRSNGSVAVASRAWLESTRAFYGDDVSAWVMPAERSLDIDTETELEFARFLVDSGRIRPAAGVEVEIA